MTVKRIYEPHIMDNPEIPFIFHINHIEQNGGQIQPNWHANIEILFCIAGNGTVVCETKQHSFTQGELFVVNSNVLHMIHTDSKIIYHCLIIDRDFCKSNGIPTDDIVFREIVRERAAVSAFDQIIVAYHSTGPLRAAKIRWAVLGLLIYLREFCVVCEEERPLYTASPSIERVKSCMSYLCRNFTRPLTLDEISVHAGISKYHLSREFKRVTGQTIVEYLNTVRCKEAERLIWDGMTVSAAAISSGFESMSYFSRVYKRCVGHLPSESVRKK